MSLLIPVAINVQNSCRSARAATDGRPGDRNGGRPHRSDRSFRTLIANSFVEVLRQPVESALAALIGVKNLRGSEARQRLLQRLDAEIRLQSDRQPP